MIPKIISIIFVLSNISFWRVKEMSRGDISFINTQNICFYFVLFVALRPKSTAMVMAGRSVHLTTLFPGKA